MEGKKDEYYGLLLKAIEDGRSRNYEASVKKLKKIISKTDNYDEAYLYLGRAYHELQNYEESIIAFRFFIGRAPKSSAGYFYLGRTYIASGKYQRAVSCFSESLRIKSDFPPAMAYMGYAMMRSGSLNKAVDYLRRAVENAPDDQRIYAMYVNSVFLYSLKEFRSDNLEAALNGFIFIDETGFSSITTKLYIGLILKELRRYEESVFYIESALEYSPDDNLIKDILAELYMRCSEMEKAFSLLSTYMNKEQIKSFIGKIDNTERDFAVAFWNKNDVQPALHFAIASLKKNRTSDMHLLAGECLKTLGRLDDAYNHFSRAYEFNKKAMEPLYGQAVILWLKQDYQGMLKLIKKILKLNPDDDFASYYRVLCCSRTDVPYSEWQEDLANFPEYDNDPWLLSAAGVGEFSSGNYSNAAKVLRKALKIDDAHKETWLLLIDAQKNIEAVNPLLTSLKGYLKIFTDDTEQRLFYAELLLKENKFSAAAEEFRFLMSSENADTGILLKFAFCCRKVGKFNDAAVVYRQILAMDPFNEKYLKMLLYCMRKDGKDKDTIPLLHQAVIAFKKPSVDLLLVYGTTLYRNGKPEEALNVFQKCLYNGHKDWRVFRNMGIIYREKGLSEWAEMYMKKADKLKKK